MRYFYWVIQNFIIRPAAWVIIRIFYTVEVRGRENLEKISPSLIIASNHKTLLDGFFILIALPWFSHFLPGRYMTEEMRFKGRALQFLADVKLLKFFYILTGGFPSKHGMGIENAIQVPLKILENGGVVLMFPEGHLIRENNLGIFYNGTAALALASQAPILPCYIKLSPGRVTITLGNDFLLGNPHPATLDEGTAIIKERILAIANL